MRDTRLRPMHPLAARPLLALVLLIVTAAGCTEATAPGPAPNLTGRSFLSTAVRDGDADRPLVPGTRLRLTFQEGDNLGAGAGCNHMGGTWRIVDGVLLVEGGAMTEMGCDEPRHDQDEWLVEFLGSSPRVALAGNELALTSGTVTVRLLDEEVADPDLPLVGTLWTVDTVIEGDAASGLAPLAAATLRFAEDGTVAIETGCNQGGATVLSDGETLRFSNVFLTKRACVDEPGRQVEGAMLSVLRDGAVAYGIDGARLTLMNGNTGIGLRGGG